MLITTIKEVDLKKLMKAKGIKSLYELAQKADISYSYLNRAYNGYHRISDRTWQKLKKFL